MKITYKGDYALKTMFELALNYFGENKLTKINVLSKKLDIPVKYLEALLIILKTNGFVKSKRGKDGGYFLAHTPSKITIGDVIRKVEGPLEPIACVNAGYKGCADIAGCELKEVFCRVSKAVSDIVDKTTLQDLVTRRQQKKNIYDYNI
jgi:Rrf2 family protein